MRQENIGPAERIVETLLTYKGHMVHNRPGMVSPDPASAVGVTWVPVTHALEDGQKVVYRLVKGARGKSTRVAVGYLVADRAIRNDQGRDVGQYRAPGLFPEVATWLYRQAAAVWQLDNEFAARWASWAFGQDNRDLKVVLAALMLVQSRKGDPVREGSEVLFQDDDFRSVGEAMVLSLRKDGKHLSPKMLVRIHELLRLPGIAQVNRELGFGCSIRRPFLGRWDKAVDKWLRFREDNPRLLQGLVKAGLTSTVTSLARRVGYKPQDASFFQSLRWKQVQARDGRRGIAIGAEVARAEIWEGLAEEAICEKIVAERPGFKRIVGLLPASVGITRAIMAAAIEAGGLSDKDLVIQTPTLEELGLFEVQEIRERWQRAVKAAEDRRAAHIAERVRGQATREALEEGADAVVQKAVEEVARGMRIYFFVDVSASMEGAIEAAKLHLEKLVQAFPLDRIHVAIFNTAGREIAIPHRSAVGVRQAFRGIRSGGGTDYGAGVLALTRHPPQLDEDTLFVFVGDEEQHASFEAQVVQSGLSPMAFGLVRLRNSRCRAVQDTAVRLDIPCFLIDERTFDDVYALPAALRGLVAATPLGTTVGQRTRVSLTQQILDTELLKKPIWAA